MTHTWPALVVTSGPQAGHCFTVRDTTASLGRSPDVDLRLESTSVSRHHLTLRRRGEELLVEDLGSANGTFLNGTRLTGVRALRPGDTLKVADVELEYHLLGAGSTPAAPGPSYDFGTVSGPVNTGDAFNTTGNQVVGSGTIHQGDVNHGSVHHNVHHGDYFDIDADLDPNGLQELFSGTGPGRLLMAVGLVTAVVGFGIWMWVIFSGMSGGPEAPSPFELKILGTLSAPVTGFAMFASGGLLTSMGAAMSKAARQREARRYRR